MLPNGGCEFGCHNTIGSYQCYCFYGLELINKTHCKDEIQCDIQQNNAGQGNHFTSSEGFQLINDITCNDYIDQTTIQTTEAPSAAILNEQIQTSTIIMFTLLIIIIGNQTVVIILVVLCSLTMRKTASNLKNNISMTQAQENIGIPLDNTIEKQSNKPPTSLIQNPDNTVATSMH